jgi:hypothetical protein
VTPSPGLAQSGSGQGGNRLVPKKERGIHGVDFGVVNWLFHDFTRPMKYDTTIHERATTSLFIVVSVTV